MFVCSDARLNAGGDARDNVCVDTTYVLSTHTVYADGCTYGIVHTYDILRYMYIRMT